jgi:hypothetical protein
LAGVLVARDGEHCADESVLLSLAERVEPHLLGAAREDHALGGDRGVVQHATDAPGAVIEPYEHRAHVAQRSGLGVRGR